LATLALPQNQFMPSAACAHELAERAHGAHGLVGVFLRRHRRSGGRQPAAHFFEAKLDRGVGRHRRGLLRAPLTPAASERPIDRRVIFMATLYDMPRRLLTAIP
jgi:hypothetical protein